MSMEYQKIMKESQKVKNSFGFFGNDKEPKIEKQSIAPSVEKKPIVIKQFNLATNNLNCTKKFNDKIDLIKK